MIINCVLYVEHLWIFGRTYVNIRMLVQIIKDSEISTSTKKQKVGISTKRQHIPR